MNKYLCKIKTKVLNAIWHYQHKKIKSEYQKKFTGVPPSIISCNCIGGVLYHELGLPFTSPTINLWLNCNDFIKFCENLGYYLSLEVTEYTGPIKCEYPLGSIDDITIHFMHYPSLEEAKEKWRERSKRINWNNIFIIATDRDGFNDELLNRFHSLPYNHKKLFAHLPNTNCSDIVYIKGFENDKEIGKLMGHAANGKYIIDQFDWVDWFNNTKS